MSAPLQAGDLLQDIYGEDFILLLKCRDWSSDDGEMWEFWNLTAGTHSWWYAASLENTDEFRRI